MISSTTSSIATATTHLEARIHALTDDQIRSLGTCKGLQEFLPRAVDFLRHEFTGHNASLIASYLMGGNTLPEGLDEPATPIDGSVRNNLHDLLRTQRFGCFGVQEPAQKTFEKLEMLDKHLREIAPAIRRWLPREVLRKLRLAWCHVWMRRLAEPMDVRAFFQIIYRQANHPEAQVFAQRWQAFCGDALESFMFWIVALWDEGLSDRECSCLMRILDAMLDDEGYRNHCLRVARCGSGEGPNGVRFNLLAMQGALHELRAKRGELTEREIYQAASGRFWLTELVTLVQGLANEGLFDEWNETQKGIVLHLHFRLHDELRLPGEPIEPSALSLSDGEWESLRVVLARVQGIARTGGERYQKALTQWAPWGRLIERRHVEHFQRLDAEFAQLVDEHHEQARTSTLREDVLLEQCKKLSALRDQARTELLNDLTEEEIRRFARIGVP